MKKIILLISLVLLPFIGKSQYGYSPFYGYGYGLRFGCGNDVDLTFTGTMLMVGGGVTYFYGTQIYPNVNNQQLSQTKINNLQTIGVSLVITGAVVLIEESIRHGAHRRRR